MESAGKLNFSGGCTSFDLLHSRDIRVDKLVANGVLNFVRAKNFIKEIQSM